jgi:hypothetical protein
MSHFKRTGIIKIAKALRDEPGMSKTAKELAVRALVRVFKEDNPLFAEQMFRDVANCKVEDDYLTHYREFNKVHGKV